MHNRYYGSTEVDKLTNLLLTVTVYPLLKVLIRQQKKLQRIDREKKFSREEPKDMKEWKAKKRADAREELKAVPAAGRKTRHESRQRQRT